MILKTRNKSKAMVPFLKSVARDLREKYGRDMSDIVVVFPNNVPLSFWIPILQKLNMRLYGLLHI